MLVSVLLLLWVYWHVDVRELQATLAHLEFSVIGLLAALYALSQILSAVKWRLFLAEAGIKRPLAAVVRAYFFGMFVNTFGLGTIGGDVARSVAVGPGKGRRAAAMGTVAADRVHGLFILILLGAAGFAASEQFAAHRLTLAVGAASALGIGLGWLSAPRFARLLSTRSGWYSTVLVAAISAIPRRPGALFYCSLLSLASHLLQIAMHILIARQFGLEIGAAYFVAMVPVVSAAGCLPISVNGIGIRESMYMLWLAPFGASPEIAAAFGAVWLLVLAAVSTCGALMAVRVDLRAAENNDALCIERQLVRRGAL